MAQRLQVCVDVSVAIHRFARRQRCRGCGLRRVVYAVMVGQLLGEMTEPRCWECWVG